MSARLDASVVRRHTGVIRLFTIAVLMLLSADVSLAQPLGACCIANRCIVIEETLCYQAGGYAWFEGVSCSPNPCFTPPAAVCCLPGGGCEILSLGDCAAAGGSWQPDLGTIPCELNPCEMSLAACCMDENCIVFPELICSALGATWHPGHSSCNGVDCTDPLFACCIEADCFLLWEQDCEFLGGEFMHGVTSCDPNPCDPTPSAESTWGRLKAGYRN